MLAGGITQGAFARDTRDESRAHHLLGLGEWFKIAIHEELRATPAMQRTRSALQHGALRLRGGASRQSVLGLSWRGTCLFLLATRVGYAAVAAADARAVEAAPLAAGVPVCAARVQTVT